MANDDALKEFLMQKHPHYQRMCQKQHWPTYRAVYGGMADPEVKKDFLVHSDKIEKASHFEKRVELTQPLGIATGICDRILGKIFQDKPDVTFKMEGAGDDAKIHAEEVLLSDWANDVDGQGTTLEELIETNACEPLQMSLVGYHIDKPKVDGEFADKQQQMDAGVFDLRANVYRAEEIVDWDADRDGILWVKLQHVVHEADVDEGTGIAMRKTFLEWILLDRERFRVWRCELSDDDRKQYVSSSLAFNDGSEQLQLTSDIDIRDKTIEAKHVDGQNLHGVGRVPFAVHYDKKIAPLMAKSSLDGAARADLAAINADSDATFSEWLHGKPQFWIKTKRPLSEVVVGNGEAYLLDPEENEEVGYSTTDSAAFAHNREVVESRKFEAHRQAGADPVGQFEEGASPESGVAKNSRFAATTELSLIRAASNAQDVHWEILEIAKRLMSSETPKVSESLFEGNVRYPSKFDLADPDELSALFLELQDEIPSKTWRTTMRRRIAELTAGEISADDRDAIRTELLEAEKAEGSLPSSSEEESSTDENELAGDS